MCDDEDGMDQGSGSVQIFGCKMLIEAYTDGCSLGNGKKSQQAGCGTLIFVNNVLQQLIGIYLDNHTNNYAELFAVYKLFQYLLRDHLNGTESINLSVYIDSKYVVDILTGTIKNIKKNSELVDTIMQLLDEITSHENVRVSIIHINSHVKKNRTIHHDRNDDADRLAKTCAIDKKNIYKRRKAANK